MIHHLGVINGKLNDILRVVRVWKKIEEGWGQKNKKCEMTRESPQKIDELRLNDSSSYLRSRINASA